MTVPGRIEAAQLLRSLDPPAWHLRHSRAVAEVAAYLAARIAARNRMLDRRLVEAAALLHDVDKALAPDDPDRRLAHGMGSAAWLARRGAPELGPVVADHPVTRLLDGDWFERWLAAAPPEAHVVAYADKRAGQRLESLDARFASWRRRYPRYDAEGRAVGWDDAATRAARERAARLEARVCELAAVEPDEVRRLPWTAVAMRDAAARQR